MKIQKFNDTESWLDGRKGRIGGTRLKDLISKRGTKRKKGFYEILAERIAIPAGEENVMDRGHRLEEVAIDRFVEVTKKKVNKDLVIFSRDDNENICYSPDGFIGKTEDVEVKCFNSASHIEAYVTKEIPSEYYEQVMQGFVVNDKLKKRYMIFYDPRLPKIDLFWIEVKRSDHKEEIADYLNTEIEALAELDRLEEELTF